MLIQIYISIFQILKNIINQITNLEIQLSKKWSNILSIFF